MGFVAAAAWVAISAGLFQLFQRYDWEEGKVRGLLLIALALTAFVPPLFAKRLRLRAEAPPWLRNLTFLGVGLLLLLHVRSGYLSARRDVRSEMGEIHYRAVKLLNRGVNPYAATTVLDSGSYESIIGFDSVQRCGDLSPSEGRARLNRFWSSIDPGEMKALIPHLRSSPDCAEARSWMSMVGLKYGPVMLLSYYPLVVVFGRPGIYLTHIVLLLALAALLFWRQQSLEETSSVTLPALVPLAILMGPSLLRFLTLQHSDADLAPTLLAVLGLVLLERGHHRAGAVSLGLSVGAKLFPALLYLPLLLGAPRKAWAWALGTMALAFGPFVAWDAEGLWHNLILFNFARYGDSTALSFYLSAPARNALLAVYVAVLLILVVQAHRRGWPSLRRLAYLLVAHLGLFLTAKVFHNNYLVWLLPLYGIWLADSLRRAAYVEGGGSAPFGAR